MFRPRDEGRTDGMEFSAEEFDASKQEVHCSVCGKLILPPYLDENRVGKKWICDECLPCQANVMRAATSQPLTEKQKRDRGRLYNYIKGIFGISEIPGWWLDQIERYLKSNPKMNYSNIWYTLYYAIELQCYKPDPQYGLSFILWYFKEAKEFFDKRKAIMDRNNERSLDAGSQTIRIVPPKSRTQTLTKIEDL